VCITLKHKFDFTCSRVWPWSDLSNEIKWSLRVRINRRHVSTALQHKTMTSQDHNCQTSKHSWKQTLMVITHPQHYKCRGRVDATTLYRCGRKLRKEVLACCDCMTSLWRYMRARGSCRTYPITHLAKCRKRLLNQGSFVLLCFAFFVFLSHI